MCVCVCLFWWSHDENNNERKKNELFKKKNHFLCINLSLNLYSEEMSIALPIFLMHYRTSSLFYLEQLNHQDLNAFYCLILS